MYLCYIDESGTSDIPGNTSHFVLAGLAIPIWYWKDCESQIGTIKNSYGLGPSEVHVGWMLRPYAEQLKVPDFEKLTYGERRYEAERLRRVELLRRQRTSNKTLNN
jgi:hypothetical protein